MKRGLLSPGTHPNLVEWSEQWSSELAAGWHFPSVPQVLPLGRKPPGRALRSGH